VALFGRCGVCDRRGSASRWRNDVLLYDLTSTYFECDPPKEDKRRFGYSRDKRSDCLQIVIALVITPEGFPLAFEVLKSDLGRCDYEQCPTASGGRRGVASGFYQIQERV
jgi:hypothetical protein